MAQRTREWRVAEGMMGAAEEKPSAQHSGMSNDNPVMDQGYDALPGDARPRNPPQGDGGDSVGPAGGAVAGGTPVIQPDGQSLTYG